MRNAEKIKSLADEYFCTKDEKYLDAIIDSIGSLIYNITKSCVVEYGIDKEKTEEYISIGYIAIIEKLSKMTKYDNGADSFYVLLRSTVRRAVVRELEKEKLMKDNVCLLSQMDGVDRNRMLLNLVSNKTPFDELVEEEKKKALMNLILKLDEKRQKAVMLYFGLIDNKPMSYRQVAEKMGMSAANVQILIVTSLRKFRDACFYTKDNKIIFDSEIKKR